jgi:nucleoside-diphosphate-sugar epimerase
MKHERVLITGISGFIGSNLAGKLLKAGAEVHGVIRAQTDPKKLKQVDTQVHLHTYDGTYRSMSEIIESAQPEICFHLASKFVALHQAQDVDSLAESNLTFGLHLAEALSRHKSASPRVNFINTGTAWQHAESHTYYPVSLYAATKQAFEDVLAYYWRHHSFNIIHLKLYDTYGPFDPRKKLVSLLLERSQNQIPLHMTEGRQLIDLVHVDDVTDAFLLAADLLLKQDPGNQPSFLSYAISSGSPLQVRELVQTIEAVSQKQIPIVWGASPYRPIEMFTPWVFSEPVPGWKPKVQLQAGISQMIRLEK